MELSSMGLFSVLFGNKISAGLAPRKVHFATYPFQLGVASGDPRPDSVVLWTRLAPDPLNGGGMPTRNTPVSWEIAEDQRFARIAARGTEVAAPDLAHSVHAEATGLRPGREYFYRFRASGEISPTGRTKTAPEGRVSRVSFAFASCQQYEHGFFTAYRHMAEEDLDVILHLGDYIYEYGVDEYRAPEGNIRHHNGPEIMTLADYRNRFALYRGDPDLRAAHAAAPWLVTWDDHEVENNYADDIPENDVSREQFLLRRAAAYQAYYEHMPLRRTSLPSGPDMRLYRAVRYGDLVDFDVLDTRQYRDNQAAGDGYRPPNPEQQDPARSLTGDAQERWLINRLTSGRARWNVLAQQVFFAQRANPNPTTGELRYSMDAWDGYTANRDRIMTAIAEHGVSNPVVLTGDVHANWAAELKQNFDEPGSRTLGVEFVGTSITSEGNGSERRADTDRFLGANPHIKFFNNHRGYVRCTAGRDELIADYRILPAVQQPDTAIHTRATFRVENGNPGLQQIADNPLPGARQMVAEREEQRLVAQKT
jgi:alkaline phosphatase D